jgi:uncharacterized protein (DUF1810 family)
MPERFDLDRFTRAQAPVLGQVQQELRAGRKRSHWMWFVFPQLAGLGHSPTARHYAIASRVEADDYMAHPILGPRLVDCTALVNAVEGRTVHEIFGSPDDLKFHSCVTLFAATAPDEAVFQAALDRYFGGQSDRATLDLLGSI